MDVLKHLNEYWQNLVFFGLVGLPVAIFWLLFRLSRGKKPRQEQHGFDVIERPRKPGSMGPERGLSGTKDALNCREQKRGRTSFPRDS